MYRTNTGKRAVLLLAVILVIAVFAGQASAYTGPYQLFVFTDKKAYLDKPTDHTAESTWDDNPNMVVKIYAVLIDQDGNMVRSGASFSGYIKTYKYQDHGTNTAIHHDSESLIDGTYFNITILPANFAQKDGIYMTTIDPPDIDTFTSPALPNWGVHIIENITIRENSLSGLVQTVQITTSRTPCGHGDKNLGSVGLIQAHAQSQHDGIPCTLCHWGMGDSNSEHAAKLGVHGNNTALGDDTNLNQPSNADATWAYNTGRLESGYTETWRNAGRADICVACHNIGSTGAIASILDMWSTTVPALTDANVDSISDNDRPSCSIRVGFPGTGSTYPACHEATGESMPNGSTNIQQTSLKNIEFRWKQKGAMNSTAHNHTGSRANVSCEICHGEHPGQYLPNSTTTDYSNINTQCWRCHNVSDGWLNITSNGGTAKNHSKNLCTNCHVENNRLNSHLVPVGAYGGRWCLDCHNLTGKAPINMKIDPAIVNISNKNYIHYLLNNRSDAANSSRICWGCHTNNSVVINGRVNSTSLPVEEHVGGFDTPRNCTFCHNNTNAALNFSAPQTYRHTWYATDMHTSAVTYCTNCHAQDEMVNIWEESVYPPKTDNESSSHYGKNRTSSFPQVGSREYCGYCHQNESTVMGPFAKPDNKVRSDHASQDTTPNCGNDLCHMPGRLHEDTLVVPFFVEDNIDTTCRSCHSYNDYSSHNSTITCWDCHMGNVSNYVATWIHPIQFIQYNGNFTGAKLTGATCYDCHKSTSVDSTIQNLSGKTAPKVYNQAHSNDPMNGTKWGDYWKYTPTTYEFAGYYVGNGTINPVYPFDNIRVPSNDYMELIENHSGSLNGPALFPYTKVERQINGPPVPNWTSSSQVVSGTTTITSTQDATYGNPAGSLKAVLKTKSSSGTGNATWNYSFYYKPDTYDYAYTNISVDYNITVSSGINQYIYLRIIKPSGKIATLATANCCAAAGSSGWLNLTNNSFGSALDEDGSVTPYKIQLHSELSGTGSKTVQNPYTVYYDNFLLKFQEKVSNRYDIIINTTGVPVNGSSKLGMSYQAHMENTTLMIYNRTLGNYEYLDTLDKGVFFDYVKDINSTHHIVPYGDGTRGNVSVRFIDDDMSDRDAITDKFHIRYLYVYTDRGLQYPCEQCHSPNKHYVSPSLGSPSRFNASNKVGQLISGTSTWCQQCHWQGAANYSEMIQEYNVTRNPPENIPPEITGNATYKPKGNARDGTAYVDHTGYDMSDAGCFSCHGKPGDTTTSQFVHNVQEGSSGGKNCTACHNIGGSRNNVNFSTVNKSMHAKLNSGAQSTTANATNKPCWGCHGTVNANGFANESDQPEGIHNETVYRSPRKCYDCHITGSLRFTTKNVTDHIPSGYTQSTDVNTSSYNLTYCSYCHNNSANDGKEPDPMGIGTGANPMNASVSHYGANKTANRLMTADNKSSDCVFCHRNSSNMVKWGVLEGSTGNISNKGNHNLYTASSQCSTCHGNYVVAGSFTFHSAALGNGSGGNGGKDCIACHDVNGAQQNVNFSAMNGTGAIHKNLNSGAIAAVSAENKKCWACHGDGSDPGDQHPTRYKSPYNCTDCHSSTGSQSGKYPGWNVTEHVKSGTVGGTELFTPQAGNCYVCHNRSEMMVGIGLDPDGASGNVYGGSNGGNNSTSHYGRKRTLAPENTDSYCNYCHSNTSSVFYLASHNRSIFEHTTNTTADVRNSTTLECIGCHGAGRIHNDTLAKPVESAWTSGQKDYCYPCHSPGGSANKKIYNQWHDPVNSSTDNITNCNYCHDSGSLGSITLTYSLNVHSDNLTFPTGSITCVACHNASSTYVRTRKILTHFPGASRDKGNTSLSARTCELCHGIPGQSMHAPGLVKKPNYACEDCHVSASAGPFWANQSFNSYIDTTSHDNTSTPNVTTCTWCHNNSNAKAPFHFTEWANGSVGAPGWGGWQAGKPVNCTDCHDSANNNKAPFYAPGKPHPGTGNNTDECYLCHTNVNNYAAAPLAVHVVIQAPGNANCTRCHDIGGAASKEVDVAAMNKSDSIHLNLNSLAPNANATAPYAADSKRCWACHGDGSDRNEHDPVRYKSPYVCEECHTQAGSKSGKYQSFNVSEHYAFGADIKTAGAGQCQECHNKSEMVKQNTDAVISSPNASAGHYGRKRTLDGIDYPQQNTIEYCNKCHGNASSVFPFADQANMTIANHSMNYPATNPSCLDTKCHATGRIHNATLVMPKLPLHNSTYCTSCHAGKERHNNTGPNTGINCTECHLNSSKSIHPARYLENTGAAWSVYNTSAANCTSCHQGAGLGGFAKARIIPAPMNHSTNTWAGGLWGSYWNNKSQQDSCRFCHGNVSYHNSSGLGLVLSVKGSNTVRMGFSGTWCANCHYKNAPGYAVGSFNPAPPEVITQTASNDPSIKWYNHSSDLSGSYTDAKCLECHNNSLASGATSLNFTHNLAPSSGGPDCVACHDTGQGTAMVDVNAIKGSMHWNLKNGSASDTTGNPANKICWACHQSDGTQPQGHPDRKKNPYNCTDCHKNASRPGYVSSALQVSNHFKSGANITALSASSTNDTSCIDCHLLAEMAVPYAEPDSNWNSNSLTSHYGKNRSDLVAMGDDSYCNYCHSNSSSAFTYNKPHNRAIFEHTANVTADVRNATTLNCIDCHTTNIQSYRLHNVTLTTPPANAWTGGKQDRCAPCHKYPGQGSTLKVNNTYHNTTSGSITDCAYCHNSDAMKSGAPQNIHSDNLTRGGNSTYNNCYNCHQNGFTSRTIFEHSNSTGANITGAGMTCERGSCHNSSRTHSKALSKPVSAVWTADGNDFCAPCHNSTDSVNNATKKIYRQGHDPGNSSLDNVTSCGNCHNASTLGGIPSALRLHDKSLTNLSGSNDSTCQGCHNGTATYTGVARQIFSHMPNSSQYRGNTTTSSYDCKSCHNMTGKPSMHSAGMNRSNGTCETCHLNGKSPYKSLIKNVSQVSGGMPNHTYTGATTCKICHNASGRARFHLSKYASGDIADPQDSFGNPTFQLRDSWDAGDTNNRGILVECRDCHEKYNDTAPFNAPYFENATSPLVQKQEHRNKNYNLKNCYVCHTNETNNLNQEMVIKLATLHNVSIEPLSGGPNCTKCHNIGATDPNKAPEGMQVNFTAFNATGSRHRNLTNATAWNNSVIFGLLDTACWTCHQSDGLQPERHTDIKDEPLLANGSMAYKCEACHAVGGAVAGKQPQIYQRATKVYKHYANASFLGNIIFTGNVSCGNCHTNSLLFSNVSGYSENINANATNASHYGDKMKLNTSQDLNGCKKCHSEGLFGPQYGEARAMPDTHNNMGASYLDCERACHNTAKDINNEPVPVKLHSNSITIDIGQNACYSNGCHTRPPPPPPDTCDPEVEECRTTG